MYDENAKDQLVKLLPFFCPIMKSALMRVAHKRPSSIGLVTTDSEGVKTPIDLPLDFRREENLYAFDQLAMPMVRGMLEAAAYHKMTALTAMFDEPALRHALKHGVSDMDMMAVYRLQEPVRNAIGGAVVPFPATGPRP